VKTTLDLSDDIIAAVNARHPDLSESEAVELAIRKYLAQAAAEALSSSRRQPRDRRRPAGPAQRRPPHLRRRDRKLRPAVLHAHHSRCAVTTPDRLLDGIGPTTEGPRR